METLKTWILSSIIAVIGFLSPIYGIMLGVGFLIILDLFLGIWRAFKVKDKITSSKMKRTVVKILLYNLAVISGFVMEYLGLSDIGIPASKIIAVVVGTVEFKSIIENIEKIADINIWDQIVNKLNLKDMIK